MPAASWSAGSSASLAWCPYQPRGGARVTPGTRPGRSRIWPAGSHPDEKMAGDITYIPTWQGCAYLATVIDSATRKIAGWAMGDNYKTPLISAAIKKAAWSLALPEGRYSTVTGEVMTRQPSSTLPGTSCAGARRRNDRDAAIFPGGRGLGLEVHP